MGIFKKKPKTMARMVSTAERVAKKGVKAVADIADKATPIVNLATGGFGLVTSGINTVSAVRSSGHEKDNEKMCATLAAVIASNIKKDPQISNGPTEGWIEAAALDPVLVSAPVEYQGTILKLVQRYMLNDKQLKIGKQK